MRSCCITQGAQPGAPWQPRGVGWGGRWGVQRFKREGTYVHLWLIHVAIWQKPTQHCKAIILQFKINKLEKKILQLILHYLPAFLLIKQQYHLWALMRKGMRRLLVSTWCITSSAYTLASFPCVQMQHLRVSLRGHLTFRISWRHRNWLPSLQTSFFKNICIINNLGRENVFLWSKAQTGFVVV